MTGKDYRKIFLFLGYIFFLMFIICFQNSFLNPSFWGLNLILISILFLVFTKKNSIILLSAWTAGLLIDSSHYSTFGLTSLVLLFLATILIILHKTVFFTLKTESILFMSIIAVALYRFLYWLSINAVAILNNENFENLSLYLLNFGFLFEIIITAVLLAIIFGGKFKLDVS